MLLIPIFNGDVIILEQQQKRLPSVNAAVRSSLEWICVFFSVLIT